MKKGKDVKFSAKAQEEAAFLEKMQGFMSQEFAQKPISDALFRMTFFYEILECESHWKENSRKSSFTGQVIAEDVKKIRELANWVWNYQYFVLPEGRKLGQAVVDEILENAAESDFTLVSAHDFTILVLLSYLGAVEHPDDLINFSSYLIIHIDRETRSVRELRLNPDPFHGETKTVLSLDRETLK